MQPSSLLVIAKDRVVVDVTMGRWSDKVMWLEQVWWKGQQQ